MKSYNGLFQRMTQHDEVVASIEEAAKYKRQRPVVARVLEKKDEKADEIIGKLQRGEWRPPRHKEQFIQEGPHRKRRNIRKPRFDDEQIIHHMLVRQLRPIILARLYGHVYGSLPGRGTHAAARVLRHWRDAYKGRRFYVFEGDIMQFFDSVNTDRLCRKLRRRIRDKRFLGTMELTIEHGGPGLAKGFYTSPWLANFYLEELDTYIVQVLKPDHYLRYVDNLFIYHRNKKELHEMARKIAVFLRERLDLTLKADWQVYRFEGINRRTGEIGGRAVNALGFVIHRDRVTIRKSILKRARAKANHIHRVRHYLRHDSASMLSRMSPFRHAQAYGYYLKWIKPKVSIQYCKRRISACAKKERKAA
jgi:hypothetical protein